MQQSYPANAIGVPVHLATIDPNGNYFDIGTVTSDINGNYGIPFTPSVPGTYQILATFAGSSRPPIHRFHLHHGCRRPNSYSGYNNSTASFCQNLLHPSHCRLVCIRCHNVCGNNSAAPETPINQTVAIKTNFLFFVYFPKLANATLS